MPRLTWIDIYGNDPSGWGRWVQDHNPVPPRTVQGVRVERDLEVSTAGKRTPQEQRKNMATINQCERCGSIGRSNQFVVLRVLNFQRQDVDLSIPEYDADNPEGLENPELCPDCESDLRVFLHNMPTGTREPRPLTRRMLLPRNGGTSDSGGSDTGGH